MICCNSDCGKEIKDGEEYISSNYGEFCSDDCWLEIAKGVVRYDKGIYDEKKELKEKEEAERKSLEFQKRPKWGDDL